MTHRLTTNYAKNYCNRTLIVKVIVENVVTCFLGGHGVLSLYRGCWISCLFCFVVKPIGGVPQLILWCSFLRSDGSWYIFGHFSDCAYRLASRV